MKILYVITSLGYGGTQKNLYALVKRLKNNAEVSVVSLKSSGEMLAKVKSLDVPVTILFLPPKFSLKTFFYLPFSIFKFIRVILSFRPDIIHSFLFQANIISRIFGKIFSSALIISAERVAEKEKRIHLFISRWTNFLVDKITVNSESLKNFVISSQKINPQKVSLIPNCFDAEEIRIIQGSNQIREELNIGQDTFFVLGIGRLHKQKGFDLLIEAVRIIVKKINKIYFVIIGDGKERKKLECKVNEFKLGEYIKFLGYKENTYDYLNASDLFVLPSLWEGSPNVILESMFFAKPVVATAVSGVKELLEPEGDKYIIELGKKSRQEIISDLAEKILYAFFHQEEMNAYGKKLSAKLTKFSPEIIVEEYLRLYHSKPI